MKIMDNGIVRDMTAEEEAAFLAAHENQPDTPEEYLDDSEALDIILGVSE